MIIPPPAIWPSSESPRYDVGMNEEKPTAVAAAKRQRGAGLARSAPQGRAQRAVFVPLGSIAHTELQAEIDAQTDEQHKERDRNHVQRANRQQAESRGDRQTGGEIDGDREDDPRVAQRQPKDDDHRHE
jgi:hypothetical protein